jgi:hypothetical protein
MLVLNGTSFALVTNQINKNNSSSVFLLFSQPLPRRLAFFLLDPVTFPTCLFVDYLYPGGLGAYSELTPARLFLILPTNLKLTRRAL